MTQPPYQPNPYGGPPNRQPYGGGYYRRGPSAIRVIDTIFGVLLSVYGGIFMILGVIAVIMGLTAMSNGGNNQYTAQFGPNGGLVFVIVGAISAICYLLLLCSGIAMCSSKRWGFICTAVVTMLLCGLTIYQASTAPGTVPTWEWVRLAVHIVYALYGIARAVTS